MEERPEDIASPPLPDGQRALAGGRYTLVRKVAEGGTAIVHLGYDNAEGQWRAIKTLLPDYARRPALRHRFEREAATMKALAHPNVIRVYDHGADEEAAWLVMEYAEGGSVIDWIERHGPMPARLATQVVLQLCEGIEAAHAQGIIHRDIKPQNLLVGRDGVCKVTDFGIAQVVQETRMTMTGTVMGTIGYMAPEQHESAKHADERADVYSIAATFYTLVKGEAATHLFMADDDEFDGFPQALADIVRRGSQYRRDLRYGSVAEMSMALRTALAALPPDPATPPLVAEDAPRLDDYPPPRLTTVDPRPAAAPPEVVREPDSASSTFGSLAPRRDVLRRDSDPAAAIDPTPSSMIARRSLSSEGASSRRVVPYKHAASEAARSAQMRLVAIVGASVVGIAFLFLLAMTLVSASNLERLKAQESRERQELYEEFREHVVILPVLESLNPPLRSIGEVHDLFERLDREDDQVARRAAAGRLYELLRNDLLRELFARNSPSETAQRMQLKSTTDALEVALREHANAERLIDEERETLGGRLATAVGF